MSDFDAVVVGAGAVGLACGYQLAKGGDTVLVLESANRIGSGVSSRNSEVVHAGFYYPSGSLKAKFCVEGRRAITFIDRSVERLGNLVGVVRELGEATAELIDQERGQCELSTMLTGMLGEYKSVARHAGVALIDRIS